MVRSCGDYRGGAAGSWACEPAPALRRPSHFYFADVVRGAAMAAENHPSARISGGEPLRTGDACAVVLGVGHGGFGGPRVIWSVRGRPGDAAWRGAGGRSAR